MYKILAYVLIASSVVGFGISSATELPIVTTWSRPENFKVGLNEIVFTLENIYLAPGTYKISLGISRGNEVLDYNTSTAFFNFSDKLYLLPILIFIIILLQYSRKSVGIFNYCYILK